MEMLKMMPQPSGTIVDRNSYTAASSYGSTARSGSELLSVSTMLKGKLPPRSEQADPESDAMEAAEEENRESGAAVPDKPTLAAQGKPDRDRTDRKGTIDDQNTNLAMAPPASAVRPEEPRKVPDEKREGDVSAAERDNAGDEGNEALAQQSVAAGRQGRGDKSEGMVKDSKGPQKAEKESLGKIVGKSDVAEGKAANAGEDGKINDAGEEPAPVGQAGEFGVKSAFAAVAGRFVLSGLDADALAKKGDAAIEIDLTS